VRDSGPTAAHVRRGATLAVLVSVLLHGAIAGMALTLTPEEAVQQQEDPRRFDRVRVIQEEVQLPKPPPPPPPPPKVEPPPEPPKPPPPKRKKRRPRPAVKEAKPAPVAPKPAEPAPFVLSNLSMGGGIQVARGETDVLGSPEVAPTPENVRPAPPEEKPAAPPKIVKPRVKKRPANPQLPEGTAALRRTVTVKLQLRVGTNGRVKKARVVVGAGEPYDSKSREVARAVVFHPATRDGVPIPYNIPWTVEFRPN